MIDVNAEFKFFPWENDKQPDFVNEDGFEWYIDKDMTKYAREKDERNGNPGLKNVACFFVKKDEMVTRVLIDHKQRILHEDTALDGMATKIDILKFALQ
ncbi:MAG: hypothetical protein JETCAE03_31840 [Ignavibacteriaceae bacterium]|nr:MAG: hypothetical protein JETCAE03_31840 [Ignavibacteriaceae bacterium]